MFFCCIVFVQSYIQGSGHCFCSDHACVSHDSETEAKDFMKSCKTVFLLLSIGTICYEMSGATIIDLTISSDSDHESGSELHKRSCGSRTKTFKLAANHRYW